MSTKCIWSWYSHYIHFLFLTKMLYLLLSGDHSLSHTSHTSCLIVSSLFLFPEAIFRVFPSGTTDKQTNKRGLVLCCSCHSCKSFYTTPNFCYLSLLLFFIKWWLSAYILYFLPPPPLLWCRTTGFMLMTHWTLCVFIFLIYFSQDPYLITHSHDISSNLSGDHCICP